MLTLFINVVQCRINIVSRFCSSDHVYIVHIDITMLYDIESTSCRDYLPLITLFTSFASSTLQCFAISNQRCVDPRLPLISLFTSFAPSTLHCVRYRNNIVLTYHTSNILVYIIHIVDIAILDLIETTLCRDRLPIITLFTSFTTSTLQCCTISNQHRVDIAYL